MSLIILSKIEWRNYLDEDTQNCKSIGLGDGFAWALVFGMIPVNQVQL